MTSSRRTVAMPTHWRWPLAALVVLLVSILALYAHTARGMATIWSASDTYAHGYVVPFITLWLIWRIRHSLAVLVPRPSPSAWILMLGAASLWLAGDLVAVNAVTHFSLVLLLVLAVPAILGWSVALAMAFPLGFLFFAVPIGDFMLPQLMEWTADFTVLALRLSGIPVYREGLQFIIPSGAWSVVEACSGIRYMIASVTVGCLFAYLSYTSLTKRFIFVGVAILVPLVANWLRAYMIVMIGHLSGNELATGVDHLIYGWVFFGVVIVFMLFIGARWADAPAPADGPLTPIASNEAAPRGKSAAVAALAALLIVASPHLLERLLAVGTNTNAVALTAPAAQSPWQSATSPPSDWVPAFKFPSATSHLGFTGPQGEAVGLHLSYYRDQDYERKLVTSVNVLVISDDKQWSQVSGGSATTQLAGQPLTVAAATLRNQAGGLTANSQRLQVWRFYWVNNRFTASDALAKIQGALSRITGQGDDGAMVVIYTPLDPQRTDADARAAATAVLQNFMQSQGGAIEAALQSTRGAP
ncbi:exosortase A [Hydrogenophaga sp.]|uniref:exosortase A n=1 Tax=Hydrogenophaga sp. TaxID=1904254 RepID=UPI00273672EB|nr:exosortase A [Hydrogenophaga sp.]MDP3108741.1 exosortase A [Hydrogenophaga sp.]